ncbi:MAG: TetR/AcrR family transcriptional regulator [Roseburia sp.]|nr:TetR/AcrR family transcriptional regulator [Roseburia sp.]
MYKICKTAKSEARQMEFQNTLLKMVEKKKLKEVTIVALCEEMGISRKTFYQYFDTVEDVLYSIIDRELQKGFLQLEVRPDIEAFFQFWKEKKWLLDLLQENSLSQVLVDRAYFNSRIIEKERYTITSMKHAGWIAAIITVLILWHHGGMQQTTAEMRELMISMFHITEA